ncbi:MAG TPA: hypothetical protein VMA13_01300 [Candidatus Saccharimonadales bacterium]|nr:hypothetical protein [Candidatus Saccharimonadales bacterium]
MKRIGCALPWILLFAPRFVSAQIDPVKRDLIQLGYNQAVEGHAPFAGYAFYYHNQPDFLRTNLTLRLALAPVYLDSELGFVNGLGPNTDFAIGLAGGGFADNYDEIRGGTYYPTESFDGHSAEISFSIYHLFNPADLIPLNFVLRGTAHYSIYARNDDTASNFQVPDHDTTFSVRTGLRWGGVEPTLFPPLAMELSVWYEGQLRADPTSYGYNDDRAINSQSHLFWAEAALSYTLPKSQQNFYVRLTAGTSVDADRFSAYRLGGFLPLISEFPLSLPGYYYQEISARQFALFNASYLLPLDKKRLWSVGANASSAVVDYLPGESQPGNWLNGVGGGILYRSPTDRWKILAGYGYGVDAIRSHGRGAQNVGILIQLDLGRERSRTFNAPQQQHWRGWQWLFGG